MSCQLFSDDHNCCHLFSCHLCFSNLFSSSSQIFAAHVSSYHVFSSFLSSSQIFKLFSVLLAFSELFSNFSALVSSSHLIAALLWPKTRSKSLAPKRRSSMLKAKVKGKREAPKTRNNHHRLIVATLAQVFDSICKQRVAKDYGTTCAMTTQNNSDTATPMRFASSELQRP